MFCVNMFPLLWGIYLGLELLGHVVNSMFNHLRTTRLFSTATAPFFTPTGCEGSSFSASSPTLVTDFYDYSHPDSMKWHLSVVLTRISPIANDVEHLAMYLLAIYVSSLTTTSTQSFCNSFLTGLPASTHASL